MSTPTLDLSQWMKHPRNRHQSLEDMGNGHSADAQGGWRANKALQTNSGS